MKPSLDELREDMRKKDREIIRLLNERSQISVQIGQVKGQTGLEVYNPAQEARVFNYLQELNGGPLVGPSGDGDFPGNYFRVA